MILNYKPNREQTAPSYSPANPPIYRDNRTLRVYQLESLNWMIKSWQQRKNVILADEMGLGKTIQAMAFLNHLYYQEGMTGPFLILAPLSTLAHWKKSFDDWSYLNSVCYYDEEGRAGREFCRSQEWFRKDITQ